MLIDLSAAAVKNTSTVAVYEVLSSVPPITTEGVTVTVKLLTPSIIVKASCTEYSAVFVVPGVNVPEVNAATIEGSRATLLKLIDTPKLANVGTKLVVDPPTGVILIANVNVPLLSVLSDELNIAETAPNEFEVEPSFVNDPEAIFLVTFALCAELVPGFVLSAV